MREMVAAGDRPSDECVRVPAYATIIEVAPRACVLGPDGKMQNVRMSSRPLTVAEQMDVLFSQYEENGVGCTRW